MKNAISFGALVTLLGPKCRTGRWWVRAGLK